MKKNSIYLSLAASLMAQLALGQAAGNIRLNQATQQRQSSQYEHEERSFYAEQDRLQYRKDFNPEVKHLHLQNQ